MPHRRIPATLVVLALFGCDDRPITGSRSADDVRPLASTSALGSFPLAVETKKGVRNGVPWTATGIVVDSGTWIRVEASGMITFDENAPYGLQSACAAANCFPDKGTSVGPLGVPGIRIAFQSGDPTPVAAGVTPGVERRWSPEYLQSDNPGTVHFLWQATSRLNVWVSRAPTAGAYCSERVCYPPSASTASVWTDQYKIGGSQTLTVTRVPPPARVKAETVRAGAGDSVTFTLETDAPVRTDAGDTTVINWTFSQGDTLESAVMGGLAVPACRGKRECRVPVARSGRMWVSTYVEGRPVRAHSEIVWARDCEMFATPPSDPFLLDPVVQNTLEDLAKRSRYSGPLMDRREYGGYFVDNGGQVEFHEYRYVTGQPTLCSSDHMDDRLTYSTGGLILIAEIHTHPSAGNATINNTGGICPRRPRISDYRLNDGPSGRGRPQGDLDPWETAGEPYSHIGLVMDPEHLHRWERIPGQNQPHETQIALNRGSNRCIG